MMASRFLDRNSVIPLYHQMADALRKQITTGEFKPGQPFPSENELMQTFGVSRNTVRQALDSIVGLGLIRKQQGKGTFVTSTRVMSRSGMLSSFTEEVRRMGAEPGVVLLEVVEREASLKVTEELRVAASTKLMCAVRVRTADGSPICVAISWLNSVRFPGLRELDYTHFSLYDLYENILGMPVLRATQQVWADSSAEREAEVLEIQPGSPVLRFARTTYVASEESGGTPIEYVEAAFVGDRYTLETELNRTGPR